MSLTLKDLLVKRRDPRWPTEGLADLEPASLADLVEILKQEGAYEVWWCAHIRGSALQEWCQSPRRRTDHSKCGMRLILPLGDTP